jgi:hypothetical protein
MQADTDQLPLPGNKTLTRESMGARFTENQSAAPVFIHRNLLGKQKTAGKSDLLCRS